MYQRIDGTNSIKRLSDGAIIPEDTRNRDWRDYQAWLSQGNEPEQSQQPPAPVPGEVTPVQMRRAIRQLGKKAAFDALMAQQSATVQEDWEYCVVVHYDDATVIAMCSALEVDRDDLFRLAATK